VDYFALLPGGAGDPEPYANPILGDVVAAARRARRPDGAPAYRERDLARAEALNRRRACNGYVLHLVSGEEWAAEEAAHGREFQTSFVVLGLALQRAAPSAPDAAFFLFAGDQPVWPAAPGLPLFPAAPRASPRRPGGAAPLVAGFSDGPGFRHGALLPTPDDLAQALGLLVPSECNTGHYPGGPGAFVRPPWGARRGGALFRGGPTGRGQAPATNPRLDLVRHDGEALAPGVPLDAGLTRAAKSARKLYFREPLPQGAGAGAEKGGGPLVEPPMDPREWRRFVRPPVPFAAWGGWRYIVNVDGNVAAFRLAASFAFGAVVVLFRPEFPCWVDALLEPRVNCLVAPDFAALRREVAWAEAAPGRAEAIGAAGRRLYEERLSGAAVFAALAGALRAALAAP
jgi:hypothetical protein